eukprot:UN27669
MDSGICLEELFVPDPAALKEFEGKLKEDNNDALNMRKTASRLLKNKEIFQKLYDMDDEALQYMGGVLDYMTYETLSIAITMSEHPVIRTEDINAAMFEDEEYVKLNKYLKGKESIPEEKETDYIWSIFWRRIQRRGRSVSKKTQGILTY